MYIYVYFLFLSLNIFLNYSFLSYNYEHFFRARKPSPITRTCIHTYQEFWKVQLTCIFINLFYGLVTFLDKAMQLEQMHFFTGLSKSLFLRFFIVRIVSHHLLKMKLKFLFQNLFSELCKFSEGVFRFNIRTMGFWDLN